MDLLHGIKVSEVSEYKNTHFPTIITVQHLKYEVVQNQGRFPFVRSGRPKRTGCGQFKYKGQRRARTFFPPQLSKFPRFDRPERENWATLIHEQAYSSWNQFWELVHSI